MNRRPIPSSGQTMKWATRKSSPASGYFDRLRTSSSHHDSNEVCKDAHHGPGNQDKDQNTGNPFFKVSVLAKKVPCIKEKAHQKDDPKYNGKDGPNGIGNVID